MLGSDRRARAGSACATSIGRWQPKRRSRATEIQSGNAAVGGLVVDGRGSSGVDGRGAGLAGLG